MIHLRFLIAVDICGASERASEPVVYERGVDTSPSLLLTHLHIHCSENGLLGKCLRINTGGMIL